MQIFIGILLVMAPSVFIFLGAYLLSVVRTRKQRRQWMTDFQRLQRIVS